MSFANDVCRSYVQFLGVKAEAELSDSKARMTEWHLANHRYIQQILQLGTKWQGRQSPPNTEIVRAICIMKKLSIQQDDRKKDLLRKIIQQLLQEVLLYEAEPRYRPTTAAALELFSNGKCLVMEPRPPQGIVGRRKFASMDDYLEYLTVGKPPTECSPCVSKNKIEWGTKSVIFEEWQLKRQYDNGSWEYVCRRRRVRTSNASVSSVTQPTAVKRSKKNAKKNVKKSGNKSTKKPIKIGRRESKKGKCRWNNDKIMLE